MLYPNWFRSLVFDIQFWNPIRVILLLLPVVAGGALKNFAFFRLPFKNLLRKNGAKRSTDNDTKNWTGLQFYRRIFIHVEYSLLFFTTLNNKIQTRIWKASHILILTWHDSYQDQVLATPAKNTQQIMWHYPFKRQQRYTVNCSPSLPWVLYQVGTSFIKNVITRFPRWIIFKL